MTKNHTASYYKFEQNPLGKSLEVETANVILNYSEHLPNKKKDCVT